MLVNAGPDYPHWSGIAALLRDSFAYMTPLLGHAPRAVSLSADDLRAAAANGTAFVIEHANRPIACLFARPSRDVTAALYLGWLAVAPAHRGQHITHALFDAAEAHAIGHGFTSLTLDTGHPLTDLHALFTRLGFAAVDNADDVARFVKPLPRRLAADDPALAELLALLRRAFAPMQGVIDPPSSLDRMNLTSLARTASESELWAIDRSGQPAACVTLTPRPGALYIGKLATEPAFHRSGLARRLIALAEARASALGLPALTLQTRIELSANHATFRALGFEQTGATAHPGYDRPTSLTFTKQLALSVSVFT